MLYAVLIAALLVAATVFVRAAGFSFVVRFLMKTHAAPPRQPWPIAWLLIRVTWILILLHVVEITVWASFYWWKDCLPDAESAWYFSGVTYTSVGYGDLVLAKPWRMLAPVEALTGILMCGLSAALFFAILTRIYASRFSAKSQ